MNKSWIYLSAFLLFLIFASLFQCLYTNNVLSEMNSKITAMIDELNTTQSLSSTTETRLEQIDTFWNEHELILYLFFNHKEFVEVGNQINQSISYASLDDYDNTVLHINSLLFYIDTLKEVLQFYSHNVL